MLKKHTVDSPQAAARLLALAVIIDGIPGQAELDLLENEGILQRWGMDREAFEEVIEELCKDLRTTTAIDGKGNCLMRPEQLHELLDQIQAPALRRELAGALFHIINADSHLFRAEAMMFGQALARWSLGLNDIPGSALDRFNARAVRCV